MSSLPLVSAPVTLAAGQFGMQIPRHFAERMTCSGLCLSVVCHGCLLCGRNGKLANPHR